MRHVLDFKVGGGACTGIWDDKLRMGRLIWLNGKAYDLCSPRDQTLIDRIVRHGEIEGGPPPEPPVKQEQMTLF